MAIENKFLDSITKPFNLELPEADTMDQYLDFIVPAVRPWGEDLREEEFYLDTRWLEIRDNDDSLESILYIFRTEEELLISIDGNISRGVWRRLEKSNTLIVEQTVDGSIVKSELFDLAFLNKDFFILLKHGDQRRKGKNKYFVLGRESVVKKLEWREAMELLFNRFRNNSQFMTMSAVIVLIIVAFILFSIL